MINFVYITYTISLANVILIGYDSLMIINFLYLASRFEYCSSYCLRIGDPAIGGENEQREHLKKIVEIHKDVIE